MHQICTDHPGEGEWARNDPVGVVGQAQQQKCDQRNRNLNANGVLGGSEKMADFQDLLDPSEEQLDRPRRLYKSAMSRALAVRSLVKMRNAWPVSITTRTSRTRADIGLWRE